MTQLATQGIAPTANERLCSFALRELIEAL
jgi:hypothetical protein